MNTCTDCGFEPLGYSDEDVITCWRCEGQEYKRMYDKEFAARMILKKEVAGANRGAKTNAKVNQLLSERLIESREKLESLEADNERLLRRVAMLEEALDNAREIVAGWLIGIEYPESLAIFDVLDKALAESKRIAEGTE